MDGWKTIVSFLGWPMFRCELLVSGRVDTPDSWWPGTGPTWDQQIAGGLMCWEMSQVYVGMTNVYKCCNLRIGMFQTYHFYTLLKFWQLAPESLPVPKRKGLSSNHPFLQVRAVKLRGAILLSFLDSAFQLFELIKLSCFFWWESETEVNGTWTEFTSWERCMVAVCKRKNCRKWLLLLLACLRLNFLLPWFCWKMTQD